MLDGLYTATRLCGVFFHCKNEWHLSTSAVIPARLDDTNQGKQKMNRNEGWWGWDVPYSASWYKSVRRNPDSSRRVWATAAATAWWKQSPCRENESRNLILQAYGLCYKTGNHVFRFVWYKEHCGPCRETTWCSKERECNAVLMLQISTVQLSIVYLIHFFRLAGKQETLAESMWFDRFLSIYVTVCHFMDFRDMTLQI